MKKLILSATLIMTAFFSQASVGVSVLNATSQAPTAVKPDLCILSEVDETASLHLHEAKPIDDAFVECSVTMKGTLDLGAFEAEISCTTTAATCQEATTLALSCIKAAVKTARTILL